MKNVESTFDSSADGWTIASGDGASGKWTESGGNPGGYFGSTTTNGVAVYVAPTEFLGDDKAYYDGSFSLDIEDAHANATAESQLQLFLSDGKHTLVAFENTAAGSDWNHVTVKLDPSDLYYFSNSGRLVPASKAQVEKILSDLTVLEIEQPLDHPKDKGGLDNVALTVSGNESSAGTGHLDLHPAFAPMHGMEHVAIA